MAPGVEGMADAIFGGGPDDRKAGQVTGKDDTLNDGDGDVAVTTTDDDTAGVEAPRTRPTTRSAR